MSPQHSPAPGTPQTNTKAYLASAVAFVCLLGLSFINDTGGVTLKEFVGWAILALVGSGLTGGVTYKVPNKAKGLDHVGGGL